MDDTLDLYRCDNPHLDSVTSLPMVTIVQAEPVSFAHTRSDSTRATHTPQGPSGQCRLRLNHHRCIHRCPGSREPQRTGTPDLTYLQIANVTMQAMPGGNPNAGLLVTERSAYTDIQASNLRICNSLSAAIDIRAPNAQFSGNNIALERWSGPTALNVDDPTSKAYLPAPAFLPYAGNGQFAFAQTGPRP